MNEELKRQLLELADKAKQVGADAFAFAQQQAPQLVKEILRWELASAIFQAVMAVLIVVALVVIIRKAIRADARGGDMAGCHIPAWILGCIGITISCIVFACAIHDMVKVLVAPRLVLLEILAGLIHK